MRKSYHSTAVPMMLAIRTRFISVARAANNSSPLTRSAMLMTSPVLQAYARRGERQPSRLLSEGGDAGILRCLIGDSPDRPALVIRNNKGAILCYGHADRATPDARVVGDKPREEIFVHTARRAILHDEAYDLVARPFGSVPRPVQRNEGVALVWRRKLLGVVKYDPERS